MLDWPVNTGVIICKSEIETSLKDCVHGCFAISEVFSFIRVLSWKSIHQSWIFIAEVGRAPTRLTITRSHSQRYPSNAPVKIPEAFMCAPRMHICHDTRDFVGMINSISRRARRQWNIIANRIPMIRSFGSFNQQWEPHGITNMCARVNFRQSPENSIPTNKVKRSS